MLTLSFQTYSNALQSPSPHKKKVKRRSKVKMQVITLLCVPVFRFPLLTDRHQLLCNPMALCWLRWGVWPKSAQQLPTLDCTICQWVQITLDMFIECNMLNFIYNSEKVNQNFCFFLIGPRHLLTWIVFILSIKDFLRLHFFLFLHMLSVLNFLLFSDEKTFRNVSFALVSSSVRFACGEWHQSAGAFPKQCFCLMIRGSLWRRRGPRSYLCIWWLQYPPPPTPPGLGEVIHKVLDYTVMNS